MSANALPNRGDALSYKQVAKKLNASERTIMRLVANGELKATRLSSRTIRIFDADLNAFIEGKRGDHV